ncbi:MAG: LptA/OstA family protein [Gammaproteobacteria bacterium]|nr:hypothetical protein [Pseudomonadales bacterium]MCP5345528.1 hypothetical protein [Pseudomonadales bacterium]
MQLRKTSFSFAILVFTLTGTGVSSLESDQQQDIVYSSVGRSTSRLEGDVRIITLEQDVKVTQGSMQISGDNAVFESESGSSAIRRVTMEGTPARYRQQLDENDDFVEGESDSIYYYVDGEPIIELVGSAILRSASDVLSCAAIKYYTDSRFTETTGPCEGVSGRATLTGSPSN